MRHLLMVILASAGTLGCMSDLGECDPQAARALVYDLNGQPAYEGQALLIQSCGGGAFCHSEEADPASRFGASSGLDFDLRLASQTPQVDEESTARLDRAQAATHFQRAAIYDQVSRGLMPPAGVAEPCPRGGAACGIPLGRPSYIRVPPGERTGPPLPPIETDEGRAILRNWLACGAPVIERSAPRDDGNDSQVGDVEPSIEPAPVAPRWAEIYGRILQPTCAFSRCHDSTSSAGTLDLSDPSTARTALLGPAGGRLCGVSPAQLVVPGSPETSLLVHKLRGLGPDGRVCGSSMPSVGSDLSTGQLDSIETWIRNGANDD